MSFVLRNENSTDNPVLADLWGNQIGEGMLVYYTSDNGITRAIWFLGNGECDGLDKIYQHGAIVPEFTPEGQKIWRFHTGAITKKPEYRKSSALNEATNRVTVITEGWSNGDRLGIVGLNLPAGLEAKDNYYVKIISTNLIEIHSDANLTSLVDFSGASGQISLYRNVDVGFTDPVQGRPEFFPELEYTFSGIAYVEMKFTADMSAFDEKEAPSDFKFFVRGKRVQNYTATGLIADAQGTAYPDQNNLPVQTKFFSANNALVAVDIALNKMKMSPNRINWASFAYFRDVCNVKIDWDSGTLAVNSRPTWTINGNINNPLDALTTTYAPTEWNSNSATTVQTFSGGQATVSGIYRSGGVLLGFHNSASLSNYAGMYYGISISSNRVLTCVKYGVPLFTMNDVSANDTIRIDIDSNSPTSVNIKFYRNNTLLFTKEDTEFVSADLRGAFIGQSVGSSINNLRMFPVDGAHRKAERYNAHVVFPQTIPAITAFEQVFSHAPGCHWQDVDGRIRFIATPESYTDDWFEGARKQIEYPLVYDPRVKTIRSNISENSYSHFFKPAEEKLNFVKIEYRNLDEEFYPKSYSFSDRPEVRDLAGMIVDSGIIPLGVATKSLADRVGETTLRVGTDLDMFIQVKGMINTFEISKGDIIPVVHDIANWDIYNSKLFIVNEEIFEPTLNGLGEKTFVLQIYRPDFYSDTAHGAVTAVLGSTVDNVVPPPPVDVALEELFTTLPNGAIVPSIIGTVELDTAYGKQQRVRVYYKRDTDVSYNRNTVVVDQNLPSTAFVYFEIPNVNFGINNVKIITESLTGVQSNGVYTADINMSQTDTNDPVIRAGTAIDQTGKIKGRDTDVVPNNLIRAFVDTSVSINDVVLCKISGEITSSSQTAQADSVYKARVDVFDKFGKLVKQLLPSSFNGSGTMGDSSFPYIYADPLEEAHFKISILNYYGWSKPIYLHAGVIFIPPIASATPVYLNKAQCPLELNASTSTESSVSITYQFGSNVDLEKRKVGESVWTLHVANISASPYIVTGLAEDTEYEFRLKNSTVATATSNIVRAKTKAQIGVFLTRPAPSALTGSPSSTNPTSAIDISWNRNATNNTGVELYRNGQLHQTLSGTATSFSDTGLGQGTAYVYKVRNKWTDSSSGFTSELAVTTGVTIVNAPPSLTSLYFDEAVNAVIMNFEPSGGSGMFTIERKKENGTYSVISSTVSASATSYTNSVARTSVNQHYYYRIKRNDVNGYSLETDVFIPANETLYGCFAYNTPVHVVSRWLLPVASLLLKLGIVPFTKKIGKVKEGDYALSFDSNINMCYNRVENMFIHKSNSHLKVKIGEKVTNVTTEHPFLTPNGFETIGSLAVGDLVYTLNGIEKISEIKEIVEKGKVYNFHVKNNHTYVANKNLVHNIKQYRDPTV